MTLFEEIRSPGGVGTHRELQEIEAMVSQTIERGYVQEIPVMRRAIFPGPFERWFLEKESGIIFALIYFDERSNAKWERVPSTEIREQSSSVH